MSGRTILCTVSNKRAIVGLKHQCTPSRIPTSILDAVGVGRVAVAAANGSTKTTVVAAVLDGQDGSASNVNAVVYCCFVCFASTTVL